ncbi:hypothetical protein EWM64_g860 [Hericium alpestre]|uniref:Uncharacterized protein n=1 Tax=Hericium alpestre TaxID=135208 RepID=A0A4Z0A7W4_9AGAM|nr:hypothetical protein EWM64_g860 [Hericium alpestre]
MHLQAITAWRRTNNLQINKETLPQPWRLPQAQHPWTITLQVCRLWRWVAMDYGGLWTDITSRWPAPLRVVLPSIEHISVIDEAICMSKYLSYFPLSSHIRYRFTMFDENSPPIANHIRYLAVLYLMSQVSTLIGGPIAYLVFADDIMANCKPFRRLELDARIRIDHNSQAYFCPPPLLNLIFDCVSHSDAYLPCFETVLNGLGGQLSHVNMMWLMDMDAYMCIDWSRLLARMRALRKVILSTDYPDPIVELMGSVAAEHCDERTGIMEREVYLPALEQQGRGTDRISGPLA